MRLAQADGLVKSAGLPYVTSAAAAVALVTDVSGADPPTAQNPSAASRLNPAAAAEDEVSGIVGNGAASSPAASGACHALAGESSGMQGSFLVPQINNTFSTGAAGPSTSAGAGLHAKAKDDFDDVSSSACCTLLGRH
jgi:hypothetical protein